MSRSGYYKFLERKPSKKQLLEPQLLIEVKAIAQVTQYSYGSRRVAKHLQGQGHKIGRTAARTLMHKAEIKCKQRRHYRVTTQSKQAFPIAENILNRSFSVSTPNRVWVTDITYLWTLEGWLYVAAVLDLFSRRVVGWALANHMRETLVHDALQMALARDASLKLVYCITQIAAYSMLVMIIKQR